MLADIYINSSVVYSVFQSRLTFRWKNRNIRRESWQQPVVTPCPTARSPAIT